MVKNTLLIFTLVLILSACADRGAGLQGTAWELVDLDGSQPIDGSTLTIAFEEGSAGGTAGCNSYGGSYQLEGDAITFNEIASTLMACMEPGVMEQESAYLAFLQDARSFALEDGFLYLYREDGGALKFKRQ